MPFPDPTGWAPDELLNQIQTGYYDANDPFWQNLAQQTGADWRDYMRVPIGGDPSDPALQTPYELQPGSNEWFTPADIAGNYGLQLTPEAVARRQAEADAHRRQTNIAGAALIGGAGAAFGFGSAGAAGAGAAGTGAAQTFPYAAGNYAGGAITGSAIPGVTSATTAANAAAAGIGPIAAGSGSTVLDQSTQGPPRPNANNALNNIPDWVGNYLLPGINAGLGVYGANQASDAMAGAADRAIAENRRQYDTTRTDLMPWLDAGKNALTQLNDPGQYFTTSPDYNFVRGEGERDIGNSFAARGGALSGNALRALTEFNSNLASGEFNNWWNRQAGRAGIGQNTAVNLGGLGQSSANATGNYLQNQGISRASGVLGRTNAVQNGIYDAYDNYDNYLYRRRRP